MISIDKVVSELRERGVKVAEATRLITKKGGEKMESLAILLHFEKIFLRKALLGIFSYSVREYIPTIQRKGKVRRESCIRKM